MLNSFPPDSSGSEWARANPGGVEQGSSSGILALGTSLEQIHDSLPGAGMYE